jgi:hypothetical protein
MSTTIEELKKTYDFPAMFDRCGNPIITVVPFTGGPPAFASYQPDRIEAMLDNWEVATTIASDGDLELEVEAKERLQQIRRDLAAELAVFDPSTQRMIVKCDIHNFELCVEPISSAKDPVAKRRPKRRTS